MCKENVITTTLQNHLGTFKSHFPGIFKVSHHIGEPCPHLTSCYPNCHPSPGLADVSTIWGGHIPPVSGLVDIFQGLPGLKTGGDIIPVSLLLNHPFLFSTTRPPITTSTLAVREGTGCLGASMTIQELYWTPSPLQNTRPEDFERFITILRDHIPAQRSCSEVTDSVYVFPG